MDWHEAVLDELRRTRAAAEKIVGMLQTMDRPVKTEHGDRLVNEDNSFVKPQLSYADWRRAAAYTNIPMEIEQIRANEANNFFGISPFSE
jgi:hypothetical protein